MSEDLTQSLLIGLLLSFGTARLILTLATDLPQRFRKSALDFVDNVLGALLVVVLIIRPFIVQAFWIPTGSMLPTLQPGDRILVNKFIYHLREPKRGEIIVFKAPPSTGSAGKDFIKRVIGLPGEVVEVRAGKVFINGKPLDEPYIREPPYYEYGPTLIPPDSLFVMGDNRNDSNDSHAWGPLPRKNVIGKALCIWWPPHRIRMIK